MGVSVPKQKHEDQGVQPGNCNKYESASNSRGYLVLKKSFVNLSMEFWEIRVWALHLRHFTIPTLPPRSGFSPPPSKIHGLVFYNSYCYKHTDRHRQKDIHTQYTRSIPRYSHAHMSRIDHSRLNNPCVHRILLSQEQRKVSAKYKTLADIPSLNHLLVNAKFWVVDIGPWRKCNALPPDSTGRTQCHLTW